MIFDSLEEAIRSLSENCHDGIIVPSYDSIGFLSRIKNLFNSGKLLIAEESNEELRNFLQIESELNELF